jgi:hypothetical protein
MSQSGNYASFGSGILIAKTSTGIVPFGALQDVQFEITGKNEKLRGQYQAPLLVARSETDYTAKAKMGYISGPVYSQLFFGVTPTVGTVHLAYGEAQSVPAATPYTVLVTNAAKFVEDFGVAYANSGVQLQPVTTTPQQGQYSVDAATGTYTFAAADEGVALLISYTYSDATNGSTIVVPNQLQGVQPVFSVILSRSYNGTGERFLLSNCISSKLSLPTQMAKFGISEMDMDAFAPNGTSPLSIYTDV